MEVEAADDPNATSRRAGSLQGDVPDAWLQRRSRHRCVVCGHTACPGIQLPSFQEIVAARTPTLAYARAGSSALGPGLDPLAAVTHRNDEACWREILMLPQSVLDPLRRGGKQHTKAAATLEPPPASSAPGPLPFCPLGKRRTTWRPLTIQPSTLCLLCASCAPIAPRARVGA